MVVWCSAWLHLNVSLFSSFKELTWPPLSGTLRDRRERLESCSELSLTRILTPPGINHLCHLCLHTNHMHLNNTSNPIVYSVIISFRLYSMFFFWICHEQMLNVSGLSHLVVFVLWLLLFFCYHRLHCHGKEEEELGVLHKSKPS